MSNGSGRSTNASSRAGTRARRGLRRPVQRGSALRRVRRQRVRRPARDRRFHQELFDRWMKGSRLVGSAPRSPSCARTSPSCTPSAGRSPAGSRSRRLKRDSIQTLVAVSDERPGRSWPSRTRAFGRSAPISHRRCCGCFRTGSGAGSSAPPRPSPAERSPSEVAKTDGAHLRGKIVLPRRVGAQA